MKIRTDFVSNSSSCSFIIDAKHARKACEVAYDKLHDLEVPYDIDQDITICLYAKNKNVDMLFKKMLEKDVITEYQPPYHYDGEDPEEYSFDPIGLTVLQFIEFAKAACADKKMCKLVDHIMFESDDYGSGPMNLRDFYEFFDRNQCHPDVENSEHEFVDCNKSIFKDVLKGLQ